MADVRVAGHERLNFLTCSMPREHASLASGLERATKQETTCILLRSRQCEMLSAMRRPFDKNVSGVYITQQEELPPTHPPTNFTKYLSRRCGQRAGPAG